MTTIMKSALLVLGLLALTSCKKETNAKEEGLYPTVVGAENKSSEEQSTDPAQMIAQGKVLFEGKGTCNSCHLADKKVIGPSIKEITKIYSDNKASIVTFLQGDGEPIVDPSQFPIMQANFAITKKMSEHELKAIEAYMQSF